jgi:hypothetical protein
LLDSLTLQNHTPRARIVARILEGIESDLGFSGFKTRDKRAADLIAVVGRKLGSIRVYDDRARRQLKLELKWLIEAIRSRTRRMLAHKAKPTQPVSPEDQYRRIKEFFWGSVGGFYGPSGRDERRLLPIADKLLGILDPEGDLQEKEKANESKKYSPLNPLYKALDIALKNRQTELIERAYETVRASAGLKQLPPADYFDRDFQEFSRILQNRLFDASAALALSGGITHYRQYEKAYRLMDYFAGLPESLDPEKVDRCFEIVFLGGGSEAGNE